MPSDWVPCIGTVVIILKVLHPLKGYRGTVKSALFNQQTSSGLRVAVQLAHLDPASPFKMEVFDYDDIIEASYMTLHLLLCLPLTYIDLNSHGCKLFDFKKPESKQFQPRNYKPWLPQHLLPSSSGSTTPLPDWSPLSIPAWDPSSHTPLALCDDDGTPLDPLSLLNAQTLAPGPSHSTSQHSVQHLLLDLQLLGTQLKVMVNGGKYKQKELVPFPVLVDGQLSIRHIIYKTSEYLAPHWRWTLQQVCLVAPSWV